MHGWLNLYKPAGVSSNRYLSLVRRAVGKGVKVGHAGTLDPLAEGILPVALGQATRLIPWCQDSYKLYYFEIAWGVSTESYDADGAVTGVSEVRPGIEEVRRAVSLFAGEIMQAPPVFSALKLGGRRLCDLKREGADVPVPSPRPVSVHSLRIVFAGEERAGFLVSCSKGFYVRSLARDLCQATGAEGHVVRLVRLACGFFSADAAFSVAERPEKSYKLVLKSRLFPPEFVLDGIPVRSAGEETAARLRAGQSVIVGPLRSDGRSSCDEASERCDAYGPHAHCGLTAVFCAGKLVALAVEENGVLRPKRVFYSNTITDA